MNDLLTIFGTFSIQDVFSNTCADLPVKQRQFTIDDTCYSRSRCFNELPDVGEERRRDPFDALCQRTRWPVIDLFARLPRHAELVNPEAVSLLYSIYAS